MAVYADLRSALTDGGDSGSGGATGSGSSAGSGCGSGRGRGEVLATQNEQLSNS